MPFQIRLVELRYPPMRLSQNSPRTCQPGVDAESGPIYLVVFQIKVLGFILTSMHHRVVRRVMCGHVREVVLEIDSPGLGLAVGPGWGKRSAQGRRGFQKEASRLAPPANSRAGPGSPGPQRSGPLSRPVLRRIRTATYLYGHPTGDAGSR